MSENCSVEKYIESINNSQRISTFPLPKYTWRCQMCYRNYFLSFSRGINISIQCSGCHIADHFLVEAWITGNKEVENE